jgi:amino acid transporter
MNLHRSIHVKGFVCSPILGKMMIIIIIVAYAATFFFEPNIGAKAYAQEINNNSTLIFEDMRAIMRDQQRDIASIRNTSSANVEALTNMGANLAKLTTQGAYTALSVFFLGIGLVVFGLRLTTRTSPQIGRYFTIMVWALTIPVMILIGLFQYGLITGNSPLASLRIEAEPYSLLSFLMYVPIGIVVFMLLAQHKIMHAQAQAAQAAQAHAAQAQAQAHAAQAQAQAKESNQGKNDVFQELERLASLKQQGLITEEEFQKLKTRLLSGV